MSYIRETVPQVLIVSISKAVLAKISDYSALKHVLCQEVSQHVQDTCSLKKEEERCVLAGRHEQSEGLE